MLLATPHRKQCTRVGISTCIDQSQRSKPWCAYGLSQATEPALPWNVERGLASGRPLRQDNETNPQNLLRLQQELLSPRTFSPSQSQFVLLRNTIIYAKPGCATLPIRSFGNKLRPLSVLHTNHGLPHKSSVKTLHPITQDCNAILIQSSS